MEMHSFVDEKFIETVGMTLANLFKNVEHSDVTILCDDGKQVKAHTFILSASSPFFRNIFSIDCEPSGMIYWQGVASDDLQTIPKFIYLGQTEVHRNALEVLFGACTYLEMTGLTKCLTKAKRNYVLNLATRTDFPPWIPEELVNNVSQIQVPQILKEIARSYDRSVLAEQGIKLFDIKRGLCRVMRG